MSELSDHLEDYLRLRRRLGFVLAGDGWVLAQFVDYLREQALPSITTQAAIEFAALPRGVDPVNWSHRLGAIRGFARYLATIDPATEIPPSGVFAGQGKTTRALSLSTPTPKSERSCTPPASYSR